MKNWGVVLQELAAAEQSFADVCDQIAKAERFFPVPGIGQLDQAAAAFKDNPANGGQPRSTSHTDLLMHQGSVKRTNHEKYAAEGGHGVTCRQGRREAAGGQPARSRPSHDGPAGAVD